MKPCPSHHKSIALLACESLGADEAGPLRQHLQTCPGCREYFEQLTAVAAEHVGAARQLPEMELSPRLRGRIAGALRTDAGRSPANWLLDGIAKRGWLAGAAGVVALVLFLVASGRLHHQPPASPPVALHPVAPAAPAAHSDPSAGAFKLMTYRQVLNRSPEELDQLLTREAERTSSKASTDFRADLAQMGIGRNLL